MKRWNELLLYPFLFSLYPVVALIGYNVHELQLVDTWRAVIFMALVGLAVLGLMRLLFRDWHRAGLMTILFLLVFFSYGHVYNALSGLEVSGVILRRHRYLLPAYGVIFAVGVWLVLKVVKEPRKLSLTFNVAAIGALIIPLFQIASSGAVFSFVTTISARSAGHTADEQNLPDIYYIILDGYTRSDVLKERYDFDNSSFINGLVDRGFVIPGCTTSNYAHTRQSLSSAIFMNYMQELMGPESIIPKWKDSELIRTLEGHGYTTIAFNNGFLSVPDIEADVTVTRHDNGLNDFEAMLEGTTILSSLQDLEAQNPALLGIDPDYQTRLRRYRDVMYFLDELEKIPTEVQGPKFVFAHIISPHYPYVLDADGSFLNKKLSNGYTNQITYLDGRILHTMDVILANSKVPPVIIIQGDHGAPLNEVPYVVDRFSILNAYHLPKGRELLYDSISPVNSFRIVMNAYFGGNYSMLPDKSYFTKGNSLYDLPQAELVTERRADCTK
jgi:hypothetical protein